MALIHAYQFWWLIDFQGHEAVKSYNVTVNFAIPYASRFLGLPSKVFLLKCCVSVSVQEYMPLPPSEESDELSATEEPKLKFSFVECLMFAFHQMARRCPNFLADEANAERLKDFKLRLVLATASRLFHDHPGAADWPSSSMTATPLASPSTPPSLLTTLPSNLPVSLYLWPSRLSTSSVFIVPRLAARTNRLTLFLLISSTACWNTVTLYMAPPSSLATSACITTSPWTQPLLE